MNRTAAVGLVLIGLLPVVGRFLPATLSWGFHHTAYLPSAAWVFSLVGWVLLFVPPVRRALTRLGYGSIGGWLFGRSWAPSALVALACAALFYLIRTPTHLLGDGVLIGELVGHGAPFRAHDGMDYLLHRLLLSWLGHAGSIPASFRLYTWGSCIAGCIAVWIALLLLRRTRLPVPTRCLIFALWLLCASTLLYCGYAESYGYLSVALLGFLWSGAMAQRGEVSPWVPGFFFGFALFFHTTALLAAPALLWLALRPAPARGALRSWALRLLLPAVLLPLVAIAAHLAAGYDTAWFRREFLESKNQRSLLVALTGAHGLFSLTHAKDLLNWLILALPVPGCLIVTRLGALRRRLNEPDLPFLLIHSACFLLAFVLLDRKLGSARDWDIFAPQIAGFAWLAGRLWDVGGSAKTAKPAAGGETGVSQSVRSAAPWVAFLVAWPWFAVNASREASLHRFDEIRADFAAFPRAYAAEELAKYYRDNGDFVKALPLYQQSVQIYPRNPRTRILLGASYYVLNRLEEAEREYDEALKIDPSNWMALDMKAKIALKRADFAQALEIYRRLVPLHGEDPDAWSGYGYAALHQAQYAEAYNAFVKAAGVRIDYQIYYYAGLTGAYIGQWDDAVHWLDQAIRAGGKDSLTIYAAAAAIEGRAVARAQGGQPLDLTEVRLARDVVARGLDASPDDARLARYLGHLNRVISGEENAVNWLTP